MLIHSLASAVQCFVVGFVLGFFPLQSSKTENKGHLPQILGEIKITLFSGLDLLSYY